MMLVVTVALAATLGIGARVLSDRADLAVDEELMHEGTKLRDFAARAVDPTTEDRYTDVTAFLESYLSDVVPESDETLFSLVNGQPAHRTRAEPLARVDTDRSVIEHAARATTPETGTVTSAAGDVRYAVFPVRFEGAPDNGTLVVAEFLEPGANRVATTIGVLAVVSVVALALAGLTSWLVAGRVLAPIRGLRQTAERVHGSDLDQRIDVVGHDDVAALADTFNRMLDRLQNAFVAQRHFLDDVSHELRTPITVVRGHLELISSEPEARARTIALVLDELHRMNDLVDDLMLLAKSERPDFLRLDDVDVTDLMMDVVAKASALGDRRWILREVVEGTVRADGRRLTQALMQLAANAVAHTRPGTEISLAVRATEDRLTFTVSDSGTGIAPADLEYVFDRFARAATWTNHEEGTGLGLPIVASIAHAHGGCVLVDSTPGAGAAFTLDLPLPLVRVDNGAGQVGSPPRAISGASR